MTTLTTAPSTSRPDVQERGLRFVSHLHGASQAVRMYPAGNEAVRRAFADLTEAARALSAEGALELQVRGGVFFANEERLRFDFSEYGMFSALAAALGRHRLAILRARPEADGEAWTAFVSILLGASLAPDRFRARLRQSPAAGLIEVHSAPEPDGPDTDPEGNPEYARARSAYLYASTASRDAFEDVRVGRALNVRKLRRSVLTLVDQVTQSEDAILAMTTLKEYDDYTHRHSVNVCIFSLLIARRLDLPREQMFELGMGALLHDVGKMRIDGDVIRKPGTLDDEEWTQIRRHPTDGLLMLRSMGGFSEPPLRPMLLAYEHHMRIDFSGYPTTRRDRKLLLASRIVTVADCFDAGTSKRSYQPDPPPADQVLGEMRKQPGWGCDPRLVRALISVTGFYPVGTVVVLDTHEVGVVTRRNPNPEELHRPIVKVLWDEQGMAMTPPREVDLAETDGEGRHRRTVIKTAHPDRYDLDVSTVCAEA